MAFFTRTLTAAVAAATLAGTFTLNAAAQAPAPQPHAAPTSHAPGHLPAPHQRAAKADPAQRHAAKLEHLKTVLQIQPRQQAAWDAYAKAITPTPRAQAQSPRPDLRTLTTPQRLDLAQQQRQAHTAKAEQRDQATRTFYASLSDSQQKAFDAVSLHRPSPRGMQRASGHGPHPEGHPKGHRSHGPAGHPAAHHAPQASGA